MKPFKSNALIIGILFIATMLVGMVDAYQVVPELKKPVLDLFHLEGTLLLGVFTVMGMSLGIVILAIAFYPVLKKQHETVAVTYVIFRTIECFLLLVGPLCYLYILALEKENISISNPNMFASKIALALQIKYYGYQLAMVVLGIGSQFLCYALYRSRLIPRFLVIWGAIGYAMLLFSAVLDLSGIIDTTKGLGIALYVPGGLWELVVFPLWLFVKGFHIFHSKV